MIQSISVTGTKGKTSLVRVLDHVFQSLDRQVLRVDTSGAYLDGALKVSNAESFERWGYSATNGPGRFLYLASDDSAIALLECTLFSSVTGLGYRNHLVGVFMNVLEDHIGSVKSLRTKHDIAEKKSFIFKKIALNGVAVYNADDTLVVEQLQKISVEKNVTQIGVSTDAQSLDTSEKTMCVIDGDTVRIQAADRTLVAHEIESFAWVKQAHKPSLYLLGFAYATLYASLTPDVFNRAIVALMNYVYDTKGGRMVQLDVQGGPHVLLDFAHEKFSLQYLAQYARSLAKSGKITAVLRLAPSRSDELIKDTAKNIVQYFDKFIIYDKVDGHWRQPQTVKGFTHKQEEIGKVAKNFGKQLTDVGAKKVEVIVREDLAIKAAIEQSSIGDIVVYIANDDSERSLDFLHQAAGKRKVTTV